MRPDHSERRVDCLRLRMGLHVRPLAYELIDFPFESYRLLGGNDQLDGAEAETYVQWMIEAEPRRAPYEMDTFLAWGGKKHFWSVAFGQPRCGRPLMHGRIHLQGIDQRALLPFLRRSL